MLFDDVSTSFGLFALEKYGPEIQLVYIYLMQFGLNSTIVMDFKISMHLFKHIITNAFAIHSLI